VSARGRVIHLGRVEAGGADEISVAIGILKGRSQGFPRAENDVWQFVSSMLSLHPRSRVSGATWHCMAGGAEIRQPDKPYAPRGLPGISKLGCRCLRLIRDVQPGFARISGRSGGESTDFLSIAAAFISAGSAKRAFF